MGPRDRAVADIYADYLDVTLANPAVKALITFGLSDRYTWLQEDYPREDGADRRPLPYDEDLEAKPALRALRRELRSAPRRRPLWRVAALVTVLKVGVIGLGEVAQVVHLPVLAVAAPAVRDRVGLRHLTPDWSSRSATASASPRRYAEPAELIAAGGIDAVLVLNSDEYHAECVVDALDHGLHVLVEKPMCLDAARGRGDHRGPRPQRRHRDGRLHAALRPGVPRGRSSGCPASAGSTSPGCTT